MLEPDARAALTEQLRPPAGYELLHAVGTTFTLDLTSALAIPLSFAAHRVRESDDPIAILDAVRRAADRVDIFAQAGQIVASRQASDLVAFLEPMVHPVTAQRSGGLFHPKVWILEYARGSDRAYRLLCSSRNLTADRSWDMVVRLDGTPTDVDQPASAPARDFLTALPRLAVTPLADDRTLRIADLAQRVSRVQWEAPGDVREVVLHALGIGRPTTADFDGKRHLIISPFLSDDGISRLAPARSTKVHVVSRAESLDRLRPETLKRIVPYVLDDAARDTAQVDGDPLEGLHAKTFVLDRRDGSHVFIGSANATNAAFTQNVEFMIELIGALPRIGVEAVFGEKSMLFQMVVPYPATGGVEDSDDDKADHALESAIRSLATSRLRNTVVASDESNFDILVESLDSAHPPANLQIFVRLLTRPGNSHPLPVVAGDSVRFEAMPLTDVTPFLVIRVVDTRGEERSTVVRAELVGDLPGRRDAVLARQIDTPEKFLRFLMLLLAQDSDDGALFTAGGGGSFGDWGADGVGLFEALVRSVGARNSGLDDLSRLIERLQADAATTVLPAGFDELWAAVWSAHLTLQGAEL
ncbi:hypothetical protein E3O11_00560 [Cryobacterium levicorallinum]|uniref:HKD family nuclease n=1 Tax=Cryobacterium levicorallinum TaxID=995038 RepID=A0A1I2ZKK3_9MICO|nr:phospholipase D family protein [Cryobacterium levicorallinum]TFB89534.1 hypothetical protein E3O11_00560 [Cryobacterium levicorallinum]GEP25872.1 hypothetical protein CLE01_04700 [Cryobacterium levicorallinum]SFH38402.1 HKD family nuclease [Cryobacterium levicorallinum]